MFDPFDPQSGGQFVKNIRDLASCDDAELLESLRAFGWMKDFPALADENGVVLVGHRRIKLAGDLGIAPVIKTINFGKGEVADAERLKLAIASNVGFQQMTKEDRRRIAAYLYGEQKWTMQRIAEALGSGVKTISRDLEGFVIPTKPPRPKGGRPKGAARKNESAKAKAAAKLVLDEEKTYSEAEAEFGLSNTVIRSAVAREEGRREASAEPDIDPETFPKSWKQKFDATMARYQRKLDLELESRVHSEFRAAVQGYIDNFHEAEAMYHRVIKGRRGLLSKSTFMLILSCLHPDSRVSVSQGKLAEAFRVFRTLELELVAEPEHRAPLSPGMPQTVAELLKRKEEVAAARRAKRAARAAVSP